MGKARDYIPALKYGHKIVPEDLAGMIGLPYVGNIFYVDPYAGDDTANSGTSQNDALKTVTTAYGKCTSGQHDVVLIVPTGGTGRTTEPAAIAWAKRFTHLIGCAAPTGVNNRAGMNFTLAAATTTPQFVLSENGCIFKNITFKQAVADSYALVKVTGDYNYFDTVHIQGIGNATAGDSANGYDLYISGGCENVFSNCTVGDANVARSAANCNLKVDTGSSMNRFEGCRFQHWSDNAGVLHANFASAGLDRYMVFDHCYFAGAGTNSGASTCTVAMNTGNDLGGTILLWDSWLYGSTDWADDFTMVEAAGSMAQATGATAGLAVAVA